METLKQRILNNWHAMRWLRLFIGTMVLVSAYEQSDWILGVLSGVLLVQAGFNLGCEVYNCSVATSNKNNNVDAINVQYEEIK